MAKLTLTDIAAGYDTATIGATNNALVEAAVENTLSRDGTAPNQMEANLDMNSYRIQNLPTAVNNTEPVILSQAASLAGVTNPLTQNTVGAVLYPISSGETSAAVTPTNYYYPVGNVLRYGADSTGGTDSATAIQAASDSSSLVYFPPGTYLCQTAITLTSNTHVYGHGATVQTDGTNRLFSAVGTLGTLAAITANVTKTDTTFGAAAGTGSTYTDGWFMQSEEVKQTVDAADHKAGELGVVTSVSTDTVTIQGLFKDSYTTANTAKAAPVTYIDNVTIEGLKLTNTQHDSAPTTATSGLIYFEFLKNSTVKNCTIYENNQAGANFFNCLDCSFVDNHVERLRDDTGILGYGISAGYSSQNINITGNTFDKCRHGVTTGTGTGSSLTPAYGVQRNIAITGNVVTNCTNAGLDTHEDSDGVTFSGNTVTGCTAVGIQTRSFRTAIVGNVITSCKGKGIRVDQSSLDTTIVGNVIRGIKINNLDGYGMEIDGQAVSIFGNMVTDCATHGIYAGSNASNFITINGNTCKNNGGTAQTITAITKANPAVVTVASHGYAEGQEITISGVGGMTEVNDLSFQATNVTTDTFELYTDVASPVAVDSSAYTTYTTGGVVSPTGDGIHIDRGSSMSRLTVTGNVCSDGQVTKTQRYGAYIKTGTVLLPTNSIISGNNLTTNRVGSYSNNGTTSPAYSHNVGQGIVTLDNSGTPSVAAGPGTSVFRTHASAANITDFTNGVVGQTIIIEAPGGQTIEDSAAVRLNGSANFVMAATDTLSLTMFVDGLWKEVARSDN